MKPVSEILGGIRETIQEAATAFDKFMDAIGPTDSDYHKKQEGIVEYYLNRAFLSFSSFLKPRESPKGFKL